jgi:hypothetical protein
MNRLSIIIAAAVAVVPVFAAPVAAIPSAEADGAANLGDAIGCRVRIDLAPSTWIIEGFDPFGSSAAESTFSVTLSNAGSAACHFVPVFRIDEPPFGLSNGRGSRIAYSVFNVTDSYDATPRAGRSQRSATQREVTLLPNESRSLLYRLAVNSDELTSDGTYAQTVQIDAEDDQFTSVGARQIVLGLAVLPSARLGLTGAFSLTQGQAVVDLGELRPGVAPVPLQLRVNSTGAYKIEVTSANSGRLRLSQSDWYVPYSVTLGGSDVNLAGSKATVSGPDGRGLRREALPIHFFIGSTENLRAGTYRDTLTISVAAN